jgi:hypothetical protein
MTTEFPLAIAQAMRRTRAVESAGGGAMFRATRALRDPRKDVQIADEGDFLEFRYECLDGVWFNRYPMNNGQVLARKTVSIPRSEFEALEPVSTASAQGAKSEPHRTSSLMGRVGKRIWSLIGRPSE